jgi:hypothetical protein
MKINIYNEVGNFKHVLSYDFYPDAETHDNIIHKEMLNIKAMPHLYRVY